MISKLDFFCNRNKLSNHELEEVARNLKYEYFKPGETVFNSLDKADKYYIMIKGKACVLVPAPDNDDFGI